MSITTLVTSLEKGLNSIFVEASAQLMNDPSQVNYVRDLATVIPSTNAIENYGWMGQLPAVQEFLTERKIQGLTETRYDVPNRDWEATIGVKRPDIEDDNLGALPMRIMMMAQQAEDHKNTILADNLINGHVAGRVGYDGVTFFNATHPIRNQEAAAQSNIVTQTGTTVALLQADYTTARSRMMSFVGENGLPFRRSWGKTVVVCGPALEFNFRTVLNAGMIAQTSNVWQGASDLMVMPEITGNAWFLLHVGGVLRPLALQVRKPVEFVAADDPKVNESAFFRNAYYYGTYARYAPLYGFWQEAIRVA